MHFGLRRDRAEVIRQTGKTVQLSKRVFCILVRHRQMREMLCTSTVLSS
jgi:hypothetical protein